MSIVDCHVHFAHYGLADRLTGIMDSLETGRFNIVCTPDRSRLSLVPDALYLKAHRQKDVYVFGGLDISVLFTDPDRLGRHFAEYAERLMAMGCDGIKMIEGKPQIRKMLPIPDFDDPVWEPYWSSLEEKKIPLLFHVNDPETFWDPSRVPGWARERGWFYGGDNGFVNNEDQYRQVINVLDRHPSLRVIFAHFFFLSDSIDRLAGYLDRYSNVCVDLAPGMEMYRNFSRNPEKVRTFFLTYQDRILYGTDIGAMSLLSETGGNDETAEARNRNSVIRNFLEMEGDFDPPSAVFLPEEEKKPFRGLGLPETTLDHIYRRNFERVAGLTPSPLNGDMIAGECERLHGVITHMGSAVPGEVGDTSSADTVGLYFKNDFREVTGT